MFQLSALLVVVCFTTLSLGMTVVTAPKEFEGYIYLGRSATKQGGIQAKDYYLSHIRGSHFEGESHCRKTFGGQLAIILTENQNTDLRMWSALPGNEISCAHIGGIRDKNTKRWVWQSADYTFPINVAFWQPGEPKAEDCICVHGLGPAFGWHTCRCSAGGGYQFICEL